MTCIVGLIDGDSVVIGGDSAAVDSSYNITTRKEEKVFVIGDFIFGFCGSFRLGNILRYSFLPPELTDKDHLDIIRYMNTKFIDEVRNILKIKGHTTIDSNNESIYGDFLVGYKNRLFTIASDFQVGEASTGYDAIGCGASYALASIATLNKMGSELPAKDRVELALNVAGQFSCGVRGPFTILKN